MSDNDELLTRLDTYSPFGKTAEQDCHEAAAAIRSLEAGRDRVIATHKALMQEQEKEQEPCCQEWHTCTRRCAPLAENWRMTAKNAERHLATIEAETIERCAKVCDGFNDLNYKGKRVGDDWADMCAVAIRALAPAAEHEPNAAAALRPEREEGGAVNSLAHDASAAAPCTDQNCPDERRYGNVHPAPAAVPIVNAHLLADLKENYEHDREAARLEGMEEARKLFDGIFYNPYKHPGETIRAEIVKRKAEGKAG